MITVYSTENCPMCNMLKAKLNASQIDYTVCTDMDTMTKLGIRSVPQMDVDGKLMNLPTAMQYIKSVGSGN